MESETARRIHSDDRDTSSSAGPRFQGRPIDISSPTPDTWSETFNDVAHELPTVPSYLKTAAIAVVAAGTGLAVGFWLGGRRPRPQPMPFSLANADFSDFAKLAPEAAHLLKNPVVRAFAARAIARQVSRYLAA